MIKKPADHCSDWHLFKQEVSDVRRLKPLDTVDPKAATPRNKRQRMNARMVEARQTFTPVVDEASQITSADGRTHRKNGVQLRLLQKLKRGRIPPSDQLDLHNMTVAEAREVLLEFLDHSGAQVLSCVRVIHGKGLRSKQGPRIKQMTLQLLQEHRGVLAYTACKPADGGDGATDILLRSK